MTNATIRITPAGAGKTRIQILRCGQHQDHPRRCGENGYSQHLNNSRTGSPPQVRGKRCSSSDDRRCYRITPAGAGKTRQEDKKKGKSTDHPRRCGENCRISAAFPMSRGSPPQVRGKLDVTRGGISSSRITPAGAGKTIGKIGNTFCTPDHPRRCGENT